MDPRLMRLARGLGMLAAIVAALAVVGLLAGGWWSPFGFGLLIGVLAARTSIALGLGAAAGVVAWGGPLLIEQLRYGIGPAAGALTAILGFGHQGAVSIAFTLLVGALLGLTGAWLASAGRGLVVAASARVDAPRNE